MEDCQICCEEFQICKLVVCKCEFKACKECTKRYLLGTTSVDSSMSCMSCKTTWSRKFIYDNLDKKFLTKDLKIHRENLLLEQQMGMMQATQVHVERSINLKKANDKVKRLIDELIVAREELRVIQYSQPTIKREFIRKCPNNDCKGFLSQGLKCALCDCRGCGKCREVKECDAHVCDPDILKSVKTMLLDSKPCPNCSSMISRVSGCNQMYCVECQTAFDWVTLRIETGVIHNPHYFEMRRNLNTGRAMECEELTADWIIQNIPLQMDVTYKINRGRVVLEKHGKRMSQTEYSSMILESGLFDLSEVARNVIDISMDKIPTFREGVFDKNLKHRISYMTNEIDKDKLKIIVQRGDKSSLKKKEILDVLTMYTQCATDLFFGYSQTRDKRVLVEELRWLREYTNNHLSTIGKVYGSKQYKLNEQLGLVN